MRLLCSVLWVLGHVGRDLDDGYRKIVYFRVPGGVNRKSIKKQLHLGAERHGRVKFWCTSYIFKFCCGAVASRPAKIGLDLRAYVCNCRME